MKKVLFVFSIPFMFIAVVIMVILNLLGSMLQATSEVINTLGMRWEFWCNNIPKGYYMNCPWKKSIIDVFCDEVKA